MTIRDEANPCEAADHHCPCGGFGDGGNLTKRYTDDALEVGNDVFSRYRRPRSAFHHRRTQRGPRRFAAPAGRRLKRGFDL